MKILLTVASFRAEYGGPAVSVSHLAKSLGSAGVDVGVWAPDQSASESRPLLSTSQVQPMTGTLTDVLRQFGRADIFHDNGIWLRHNHRLAVLAARLGVPRVVSPRGMLEPWARRHKARKKKLAWSLYQRRDLRQANLHHATAGIEGDNLKALDLGVPIKVIPNGVEIPNPRIIESAASGSLRTMLFLGRLYPIKGLPQLIEAWSRVRPFGWVLKIAGPDEAGHKREIQKAIDASHLGDAVSFLGSLDEEEKDKAFSKADVLVLPSHSESFGMAVVEALAHGMPVLATKGTPWSILADCGCGWWVDATVDGLAAGLREVTASSPQQLRTMGEKGRAMAMREFAWDRVAKEFCAAYEDLLR